MENSKASRDRVKSISKVEPPTFLTILNKFIRSVEDMDKAVLLPSRLLDIPTNNSLSLDNNKIITTKDAQAYELYDFYSMLLGMKLDLTSHNCDNTSYQGSDEKSYQGSDENLANDTLTSFRYHVNELNTLLHQLTNVADLLKKEYKESVGDTSEDTDPRSWSL